MAANNLQAFIATNLFTGPNVVDLAGGNVTTTPESPGSYNRLSDNQADELLTFNTTTVAIVFDFATTVTISSLALINWNFTTSATVTLKANTDLADLRLGNSSIPAITIDVTDMEDWHRNTYKLFDAETLYQYWRIDIDDATVPGGKVNGGEIFIGDAENTPKNLNLPLDNPHDYETVNNITEGQNEFSYLLDEKENLVMNMKVLQKAEWKALKQFLFTVKGKHFPFVFIPDTTENMGYFGKLVSGTAFNRRRAKMYDASNMNFKVLSNGFFTE